MIETVFSDGARTGFFDLESVEFLARDAMHRCGASILEKLIEHAGGARGRDDCECGGRYVALKHAGKLVRTVLGEVAVIRKVFRCNSCGDWKVPLDEELDVVKTGFSPGLRRLMSKVGSEVCFDKGRDFLFELAGVRLTDKDVERESESVGADVGLREDEKGKVDAIVSELRSMKYRGKKKAEVEKTADYFEKNKERMRYDKFRRQGLFIGSGVVEAGCKSVIGKRLKQSGMHWSVRGANSIIALRCCLESGRFEDYWEQRQAA